MLCAHSALRLGSSCTLAGAASPHRSPQHFHSLVGVGVDVSAAVRASATWQDLMGFAPEQIVRDVLDQFESHRQLLGRVYS